MEHFRTFSFTWRFTTLQLTICIFAVTNFSPYTFTLTSLVLIGQLLLTAHWLLMKFHHWLLPTDINTMIGEKADHTIGWNDVHLDPHTSVQLQTVSNFGTCNILWVVKSFEMKSFWKQLVHIFIRVRTLKFTY